MSALPTPLARKALVKEMWESGAETIVSSHIPATRDCRQNCIDARLFWQILIDHDTHAGFGNIAEAREFLLKQGRKHADNPNSTDEVNQGCHVIAPVRKITPHPHVY